MENEFIIFQGKKFQLKLLEIFYDKEIPVIFYVCRSNNLTETLNKYRRRTSIRGEKNNIRHGIVVNFIFGAFKK